MHQYNLIILAGGKASRMGDICSETPKCLLDIAGKTLLERQLDMLKGINVAEAIIAAHHLAPKISPLAEQLGLGMYVSSHPEGTGGAIYHTMLKFKRQRPTIVLNGDILMDINMTSLLNEWEWYLSDVMIVGQLVPNISDYGSLVLWEHESETVAHLAQFKEKTGQNISGYINAGIYVIMADTYIKFEKSRNKIGQWSVERDTFPKMLEAGYLLDVFLSQDNTWIDCGTPERLELAQSLFRE